MERPSFLDQEPPAGYVPGIGRGATGFSTKKSKWLVMMTKEEEYRKGTVKI